MISFTLILSGFWPMVFMFCSLMGFFLGGILFFMKRGNRISNRLLSILVFLDSLFLLEYLLITSGMLNSLAFYIPVLTPLTFLIGPVYLFYVKSSLVKDFTLQKSDLLHFIPAVLLFINYLPYYFFLAGFGKSITDTDQLFLIHINGYVEMSVFIIQTIIYIKYSFQTILKNEFRLKENLSNSAVINANWLKTLTGLYLIFLLVQITALIILIILPNHINEIEYLMLISEALIIFTVAYYSIAKPEILNELVIPPEPAEKYQRSGLSKEIAGVYAKQLTNFVIREKPYLNENLKILELAESLEISVNHLSQILNQNFNTNFYDFINSYRISEAKAKLLDPEFRHLNILGIALESGFNSKVTFNRIFKKHTGQTPTEFIKSHHILQNFSKPA